MKRDRCRGMLNGRDHLGRWSIAPAAARGHVSFILLMAASLLWATSAWGSWTSLNSGTNRNLRAVHFPVEASTGYAVGWRGTIQKTTNGGANWSKQQSKTRENLLAVYFPTDNSTGYAVGVDGVIVKTTNGGSNWTKQTSGTTNNLQTVHFPVDATTGYAGGASSTILKTTDGGSTWSALPFSGGSVQQLYFPVDTTIGYAAVTFGSLGRVYKTTDGGQTWVLQLTLEDQFMQSIHFPVDNTTGYFATFSTIHKTTDGGVTWVPQVIGLTGSIFHLHFPVDTSTGFAVGAGGVIYTTTNGGADWTEAGTGTEEWLYGVYFVDNSTGYAVGDGGEILKTTDGGGGNTFVEFLHPVANGSIMDFTSFTGCSVAWDCVNDQLNNASTGQPEPPAPLSFIEDDQGNRAMFALADGMIPAGHRVTKIRVSVVVSHFGAPRISISYQRVGIDPNPIDSQSFLAITEFCCATHNFTVDTLNWTPADIDALEIGLVHVSGSDVNVEQVYVKLFHEPL